MNSSVVLQHFYALAIQNVKKKQKKGKKNRNTASK